jgi:hypothetical protein
LFVSGNLNLELRFSEPLSENVQILVVGEFSENVAFDNLGVRVKPSYNTNKAQA